MPTCKNGKGSYRGTEPSPKGRGYCARHQNVGTKKRGKDKKIWVVRSVKLSSGKRSRRWFKVLPKAKKKKTKPIQRKATKTLIKKKTTRCKKLRGGQKTHYVFLKDLSGKTHEIAYNDEDEVCDTLTGINKSNAKMILGDGGQKLYTSENQNLTWAQLKQKAHKPIEQMATLYVI